VGSLLNETRIIIPARRHILPAQHKTCNRCTATRGSKLQPFRLVFDGAVSHLGRNPLYPVVFPDLPISLQATADTVPRNGPRPPSTCFQIQHSLTIQTFDAVWSEVLIASLHNKPRSPTISTRCFYHTCPISGGPTL
jgi:hypothetical protein